MHFHIWESWVLTCFTTLEQDLKVKIFLLVDKGSIHMMLSSYNIGYQNLLKSLTQVQFNLVWNNHVHHSTWNLPFIEIFFHELWTIHNFKPFLMIKTLKMMTNNQNYINFLHSTSITKGLYFIKHEHDASINNIQLNKSDHPKYLIKRVVNNLCCICCNFHIQIPNYFTNVTFTMHKPNETYHFKKSHFFP